MNNDVEWICVIILMAKNIFYLFFLSETHKYVEDSLEGSVKITCP